MNLKPRCALPLIVAALLSACGGSDRSDATTSTITASSSARSIAQAGATAAAYYDVVQKIYVGYFGRPADPGGLEFYAGHYMNAGAPTDIVGMSQAYGSNAQVKALIDSFGTSDESAALYPGDNRTFITAIYGNLFNRAPDAAGLDYWANAVEAGHVTRANASISIMAGAQGTDATSVTRKQQVAAVFTGALDTPENRAAYSGLEANVQVRAMLATVNHSTDVEAFRPTVAATITALRSTSPAAAPLRTGGTVHKLISSWTGTGFQLLSTAPASPTYRPSPHAGSAWDNTRRTLWIFGSETHGSDMDNAVYGWRASDGLFIKQYDADDKAGYRMDANGIYWSSAAKNRPWAMHTYRRLRWVDETSEIEVMYDANEHAYVTPIFEAANQTVSNRVPPVWYYNVVTGAWRAANFGQSAKFAFAAYIFPSARHPTYGWFTDNGATWTRMTADGTVTTASVFGKANSQYHSFLHTVGDIAYKVGGHDKVILYSKHPLNNLAASEKFLVSAYPALAGFDTTNMASVLMPNGKIILFPIKGTETHAMLLDPVANTVTATGHFFTGMDKAVNYELAAEWSPAHNAAIFLSRRFVSNRVYAYRP